MIVLIIAAVSNMTQFVPDHYRYTFICRLYTTGPVGVVSRLVQKYYSELGCSEHTVLELYGVSTTEVHSKSGNTGKFQAGVSGTEVSATLRRPTLVQWWQLSEHLAR